MTLHYMHKRTSVAQEDSFHLVDNRPAQKNKGQRRFNPQRFAHRNTQFNRGQPEQPHQARQKQQKQRQFQNFHRDNQRVHQHSALLLKHMLPDAKSYFSLCVSMVVSGRRSLYTSCMHGPRGDACKCVARLPKTLHKWLNSSCKLTGSSKLTLCCI